MSGLVHLVTALVVIAPDFYGFPPIAYVADMSLGYWVLCYLLLTLGIGLLASRLIHSSADFLSASRRLPLMLNASALFAFWFGSETVLGASSEFIRHGVLGVIEDPFGGFLCLLLFALVFVRPLYRQNILTLGDLFRRVYGPGVERLATVLMILSFFGYVAAQILALGILFETVFGMGAVAGRLLSAFIVIVYTAAGGMWSVSITDFLQSVVIVLGLVLLAVYLTGFVSPEQLLTAPQPHFFDWVPTSANGLSWMDYLAAWCTLGLGSLASQDIFQRANAARSERIAVRSTYLGAFLYLIIALIPLYLGLLAHQLMPEVAGADSDTQYALVQLISGFAPLWLQILFYGALISAVFSTCSGAMLAPASLLAENLIRPLYRKPVSDDRFLVITRLSVLCIGLLSAILALMSTSIYELVSQSSILGMVSILVPLYAALFHPASQRTIGAVLSMSLGILVYGLAEYGSFLPEIPAMFSGLAASIAGLLIGNHGFPRPLKS